MIRFSKIHQRSTLDGKGYVVMAILNTETEDAAVKANIAITSLLRVLECVEAFAHALGYKDKLPDEARFAERIESARNASWRPFSLLRSHLQLASHALGLLRNIRRPMSSVVNSARMAANSTRGSSALCGLNLFFPNDPHPVPLLRNHLLPLPRAKESIWLI